MCRRFIPLLAPEGRIVNLSSVASSLKDYGPGVQQRFRDPDVTVEKLDKLVEEFIVRSTLPRRCFCCHPKVYPSSTALRPLQPLQLTRPSSHPSKPPQSNTPASAPQAAPTPSPKPA